MALLWNWLLVLTPVYMAAIILGSSIFTDHQLPAMIGTLLVGLFAFCVLFAINSSVHSYLIGEGRQGVLLGTETLADDFMPRLPRLPVCAYAIRVLCRMVYKWMCRCMPACLPACLSALLRALLPHTP